MLLLNFNFGQKSGKTESKRRAKLILKLPGIKILSMIGRNEREHFKTHGQINFLGSPWTIMLRKCTCTASTIENFHICQIGKMPLLGELKIYALMDLSYTINTRSTCYVSSIGLRNLMIPRQLPALHRPLLTPQ